MPSTRLRTQHATAASSQAAAASNKVCTTPSKMSASSKVSVGARKEDSLLQKVRNSWRFANLCQWIFLFGAMVKIPGNVGVDELEAACLDRNSTLLLDVGLALLSWVSSHRGLNHQLFDEYTRRQFVAKDPECNPFGTDEVPAKFLEFDVFTKLRVLNQLTVWAMRNPERVREKMGNPRETEQTDWRIEPFGWDAKDRTYFVLDDNRLYRMTSPLLPPARKKTPSRARRRPTKRLKPTTSDNNTPVVDDEASKSDTEAVATSGRKDDGLGNMTWECLAVTLEELNEFLATIAKTRDPNEKMLRDRLQEALLPILEQQDRSMKRKMAQRERELLALEKMVNAKRSSRIASRTEQKKAEEVALQEEQKRRHDERMAAEEEARRQQSLKLREQRLLERERRLRELEARQPTQDNSRQPSEESASQVGPRPSRQLRRRTLQKRKVRAGEEEENGDEAWVFDCVCGVYGHVDDGTHSVCCDRCKVWQHSKCLDINQEAANQDDFHFTCPTCVKWRNMPLEPTLKTKTIIRLKLPLSMETHATATDESLSPLAVVVNGNVKDDAGHEGPSSLSLDKCLTSNAAALNAEHFGVSDTFPDTLQVPPATSSEQQATLPLDIRMPSPSTDTAAKVQAA